MAGAGVARAGERVEHDSQRGLGQGGAEGREPCHLGRGCDFHPCLLLRRPGSRRPPSTRPSLQESWSLQGKGLRVSRRRQGGCSARSGGGGSKSWDLSPAGSGAAARQLAQAFWAAEDKRQVWGGGGGASHCGSEEVGSEGQHGGLGESTVFCRDPAHLGVGGKGEEGRVPWLLAEALQ